MITYPHQLFNLLDDPGYEISAVRICNKDLMEVVTTMAEEEYERSLKPFTPKSAIWHSSSTVTISQECHTALLKCGCFNQSELAI